MPATQSMSGAKIKAIGSPPSTGRNQFARMRHTVDFDAVRDDLVGVVHEAFQPTQVSMWLALPDGQRVAGFEQRLEVGQDPRPPR